LAAVLRAWWWRLRRHRNSYKVVDIIIEGESMVLTLQDAIGSLIYLPSGNLDDLLEGV